MAAATLVDTALKRRPYDSDCMKESFTRKIMELAARANQINQSKKQKKYWKDLIIFYQYK